MPEALDHFRAHRHGLLVADDVPSKVRFVIDGATGRLVFPATGAMLAAEGPVLFVPEETPDGAGELQLLLAIDEFQSGCEACDRWLAYHGEPRLSRWAAATVEGAKFEGRVVDHELMNAPNPLRASEPRLCKRLNADRAALAAACKRATGVELADPLAVGIDAWGIDVRARFGIVRLPLDRETTDSDRAAAAVEALLAGDPP